MVEAQPIYFGMPLRSSITTRDWPLVCELFRNTIRSIQGQSDGDFRILVACHEQPDIGDIVEPRLEFLAATGPRPDHIRLQMIDKRQKIRLIADEICRRGGGYFFLMDADDLVSNRLAAYIRDHHNGRGFLVERGYVLNIGRHTVHPVADFWRQCGSCAVFYLEPADLALGDTGLPGQITSDIGHRAYRRISAACGRPLEPLPFAAALYVRNHGENRSSLRRPWKINTLRNWLYRGANLFRGLRPLPPQLREEFSIPYAASCPADMDR